jgi:hydroxymethylbilane synthase
VLAAAGLRRLGHNDRISALLPTEACVPAPGQGTIAVETRTDDAEMVRRVATIDDAAARTALTAERAVVERLGGGCQMPIGAFAVLDGSHVSITAVVVSPDGVREVRATARDTHVQAHRAGVAAADDLLAHGAGEILAAVWRAATAGHAPS